MKRIRAVLLVFQVLACATLIAELCRGFFYDAAATALAWGVIRVVDDFLGRIIIIREAA